AARARCLWPSTQRVILEHVANDERNLPHVVPRHAGAGIEIDAQLIGMIEIVGAHGMRIEVDASEVDDPEKLGSVADDDLTGRTSRRKLKLDRLDPVRMLLRRPLLKKRFPLGSIHVALEHDRSRRDASQRAVSDGVVVANEIELRVARARKVD